MIRLKLIDPSTGHEESFNYKGSKSEDDLRKEIGHLLEDHSAGIAWIVNDGVVFFPSGVLKKSIVILENKPEQRQDPHEA